MIKKVSVVVYKLEQGKPLFLVAKRIEKNGGFWQYVTGHLEKDESYESGAVRELKEELGDVMIKNFFAIGKFNRFKSSSGRSYIEKMFATEIDDVKKLQAEEFCEFEWLDEKSAIDRLHYQSHRDAVRLSAGLIKQKHYPKIFIIVGSSGSGKTSVITEVIKGNKNLRLIRTCMTRPYRRAGDKKFRIYLTKDQFGKLYKEGGLLEKNYYCDNWYGVPRSSIEVPLFAGYSPIGEIDINGMLNIKKLYSNVVSIFLKTDLEFLKKRIILRGGEEESEIEKRLETARGEIAKMSICDYIVENKEGQLAKTVRKLTDIINKELG